MKVCKNCQKPIENHSLYYLKLCKGELDAKQMLEKLRRSTKLFEDQLRRELEEKLGEEK